MMMSSTEPSFSPLALRWFAGRRRNAGLLIVRWTETRCAFAMFVHPHLARRHQSLRQPVGRCHYAQQVDDGEGVLRRSRLRVRFREIHATHRSGYGPAQEAHGASRTSEWTYRLRRRLPLGISTIVVLQRGCIPWMGPGERVT